MGKRGRTPVVYTLERACEVRRRVREAGERVTSVCADMGMNYENFLRWCRRNKFEVHSEASRAASRRLLRGKYAIGSKPQPIRAPRVGGRSAAIAADLKEGRLTPLQLAEKHGVGYPYVIQLRKMVGLNPPAGKGRNIKNTRLVSKTDKRNGRILKALATGVSVAEIARRHGLSRQTIYNIRKRKATDLG